MMVFRSFRGRAVLIAASVLFGVFLGLVATNPARAGVSYLGLYVYEGSSAAYHPIELLCGWHDVCGGGDMGWGKRGIDWVNGPGQPVYWRSKNYRSDVYSTLSFFVDTTDLRDSVSCPDDPAVRASVRDIWGLNHESLEYRHTAISVAQTVELTAGNGAWVDEEGNGGSSWGLVPATVVHIGSTNSPCYAPHLHQQTARLASTWVDNKAPLPNPLPMEGQESPRPYYLPCCTAFEKEQAWTQWQVSW